MINIKVGSDIDLEEYCRFSKAVQQQIEDKILNQYVPSAHKKYHQSFKEKLLKNEFHVVNNNKSMIAGFYLSVIPPDWWKDRYQLALYFSNLVINLSSQGKGIGKIILNKIVDIAKSKGKNYIRLDCHSDNLWLCSYYVKFGFKYIDKIKQHHNYWGNLYEYEI